jgi:pimeloyl-ACP methyl ester carboxylesterase
MRRIQTCLPGLATLIVLSLSCSAIVRGQAKGIPGAMTSNSCTSQTGLYCESYGSGPPMLFLHGLGGSTYSWRYMVAPFSVDHQVILIDLRGEGKSPKPHDKHYSILDQGELIHQFIVEHDLRNLTLVGNSYGGAVSLLLAIKLCAENPSRLSKLILIDSGGYPDHLPAFLKLLRTPILGCLAVYLLPAKAQIRMVLKKSYYDPAKITEAQVDAYAGPLDSPGGRHALLEIGKRAIPKDIQTYIAKYPTISVPTLILWGEDDRVLPTLIGQRLNAAIPGSLLEQIKFAGHIPQEEQPDAVIARIKAFLQP